MQSSAQDDTHADGETEPGLAASRESVPAERAREQPGRARKIVDGQLLDDRYLVERLLGRGAMGEVHLALDQRLARQVALKLVRAGSERSARRLQSRLQREALALARVAHPNVVAIYDVGSYEGQTYLTMQFVEGTTLRDWQQLPHARDELLDAYLQAGRGLAAAHSVGVVHRDFKPDNVIRGDDGIVRVLDFGLAAAQLPDGSNAYDSGSHSGSQSGSRSTLASDASQSGAEATLLVEPGHASGSERMTQAGALLGTVAYMSSEQLEGRDADARSDQFSFCVAMWEALCGERPFAGGGLFELIFNMRQGPRGGQALPRWLRGVLARGLAIEPAQRWPDMRALIDAIERGRARPRKLAIGAGLPVVILGAVLLGINLSPPSAVAADTCTPFVDQVDARWGPRERTAIFSHAAHDSEAAGYVVTNLDELAADWKLAAASLCEGQAAPPAHTPEHTCMQRWLDGFADTVELLSARSDARTLEHAPDLLVRLRPPPGDPRPDYCALGPQRAVDPEVWRLSERAQALVVLGDLAAAQQSAEQALTRAEQLDELAFSGERALAHFARADVEIGRGRSEAAIEQLGLAQRHALAASYPRVLLSTWTAWATVLVLGNDATPADAALALVRIEQAEPLLVALDVDDPDARRAELLEARGLAERARLDQAQAIAWHRAAQAMFVAAGQPTLASRSLVNLGANYQDLGEPELARRAYDDALALLDAAELPAGYRSRVLIHRNLALLAYASSEPAEIAAGIPDLEFVLAHGNDDDRFEAHELMLALVLELDDDELTRTWATRALAALDAHAQASAEQAFRIQRVAGIALAYLGDARGEALLIAAERSAAELTPPMQLNLQLSWVEWLESVNRCADALARREHVAALADALADQADAELLASIASWRAAGPTADCADASLSRPNSRSN